MFLHEDVRPCDEALVTNHWFPLKKGLIQPCIFVGGVAQGCLVDLPADQNLGGGILLLDYHPLSLHSPGKMVV